MRASRSSPWTSWVTTSRRGWTRPTNVMHARRFVAAAGMWGTIDDLAPATNPRTRSCSRRRSRSVRRASRPSPGHSTPTRRNGRYRAALQVQTRTQDTDGNWRPWCSTPRRPIRFESRRPAARRRRRRERDARVGGVPVHLLALLLFVHELDRPWRRDPPSAASGSGAQTLSDPILISDSPRVATTPAGEMTVAWTEGAANAVKVPDAPGRWALPRRRAATIIIPQDKAISSGTSSWESRYRRSISTTTRAGRSRPSGAAMARTARQAVFRPAGGAWPNPATTPPTALSAPGAESVSATSQPHDGGPAMPWSRGREAASSRQRRSTPRLPLSPESTSPRPARPVSRSQCPPHARHLVGARRGPAELELR